MRNFRQIILLLLVVAAGGVVTAIFDWGQERRADAAEATHSAESLVGLLSLYPLHEADAAALSLLSKAVVEQSGTGLA